MILQRLIQTSQTQCSMRHRNITNSHCLGAVSLHPIMGNPNISNLTHPQNTTNSMLSTSLKYHELTTSLRSWRPYWITQMSRTQCSICHRNSTNSHCLCAVGIHPVPLCHRKLRRRQVLFMPYTWVLHIFWDHNTFLLHMFILVTVPPECAVANRDEN